MWNQLRAWFKAYRIPILVGSGGIVAYTAYANAQNRAAAAAAPMTVAGGRPAGEEAAFIGQGAGLAVAAQTPILGLAQEAIGGGLGLAGMAAQTAAGVAETAAGSAVSGTFALADVLGQLASYMTQPTAAPTLAPSAPAPSAPAPSAPAAPARALTGYELSHGAGSDWRIFTIDGSGNIAGARNFGSSSASYAVTPGQGNGFPYWLIRSGSYAGWAFISNQAGQPYGSYSGGPFVVQAVYSDGTREVVAR